MSLQLILTPAGPLHWIRVCYRFQQARNWMASVAAGSAFGINPCANVVLIMATSPTVIKVVSALFAAWFRSLGQVMTRQARPSVARDYKHIYFWGSSWPTNPETYLVPRAATNWELSCAQGHAQPVAPVYVSNIPDLVSAEPTAIAFTTDTNLVTVRGPFSFRFYLTSSNSRLTVLG